MKKFSYCSLLLSLSFLNFSVSAWESPYHFLNGKEVLSETGKASKREIPRTAKVLVWNVYKGRKENFTEKFNENIKGADLILLQEFTEDVQRERLKSDQSNHQYNFASTVKFLGEKKAGVSTAAGAKSLSSEFQLSDGIMGIIPPKAALFTTYKISGTDKTLLVINIHGKNAAFLATYQAQISKIYQRIIKHHGPVLFAGDFNSWSTDRFDYIKNLMAKADLKMIKFEHDNRMKAKVVSKWFDYFDYPLDNVFYKGFEIKNARSLEQEQGSDHGAMTFDIVFSARVLDSLRDLRPGGSGDYTDTFDITYNLLVELTQKYDLSTMHAPSILQIRNRNAQKEKFIFLPGQSLVSVDESAFINAKMITLNFLAQNKLPMNLNECLWGLDFDGETLFIRLMKELLKKRVVDELKFIQIISKHADKAIECR